MAHFRTNLVICSRSGVADGPLSHKSFEFLNQRMMKKPASELEDGYEIE